MGKTNLRPAAVAGFFYPQSAASLKSQIASFMPETTPQKEEAIACMLPHAGYVYSGSVAVKTLARLTVKNRVLMIGPNHTGTGKDLSIRGASWQSGARAGAWLPVKPGTLPARPLSLHGVDARPLSPPVSRGHVPKEQAVELLVA